jgi:hypothetical protein
LAAIAIAIATAILIREDSLSVVLVWAFDQWI